MSLVGKIKEFMGRCGNKAGSDPRRVRVIPGAVPRSPLERLVVEVLAAHPGCPWAHLVAVVAQHLRQLEHPSVLAALDEGIWGYGVWSDAAQEEITRLDGVLLQVEIETVSATESNKRIAVGHYQAEQSIGSESKGILGGER